MCGELDLFIILDAIVVRRAQLHLGGRHLGLGLRERRELDALDEDCVLEDDVDQTFGPLEADSVHIVQVGLEEEHAAISVARLEDLVPGGRIQSVSNILLILSFAFLTLR